MGLQYIACQQRYQSSKKPWLWVSLHPELSQMPNDQCTSPNDQSWKVASLSLWSLGFGDWSFNSVSLDASKCERYSPRDFPQATCPRPSLPARLKRLMMILDRYLLRQFVQIFVICFLSLTGLYVVIDAFGHLDHFSAYAAEHGNLIGTIAEYYGYRSLSFFDRTSGMLAMIAAMFTVTWLERHHELTAILAAGISKFRVIKPVLIAAVIVSLLAMANREFVIPNVRDKLTRNTKDLGGDQMHDLEACHDGRTGILISGEKAITAEKRIVNPTFVLPAALSQYGSNLVARDAYYQPATNDHPSGYLLDGVKLPRRVDKLSSLLWEDDPVIIAPKDAAWLESKQLFVVSQVRFQLLSSGSAWRNYASTGELIAELGSPSTELGTDVRVAVHSRLMQPLMDGTLLMLGLPLMFSRRKRNVFFSFSICLGVAIAFTMVTLACHSLGGLNLLRPTLAAWLPILVFLPVAVAMSHTFRT